MGDITGLFQFRNKETYIFVRVDLHQLLSVSALGLAGWWRITWSRTCLGSNGVFSRVPFEVGLQGSQRKKTQFCGSPHFGTYLFRSFVGLGGVVFQLNGRTIDVCGILSTEIEPM